MRSWDSFNFIPQSKILDITEKIFTFSFCLNFALFVIVAPLSSLASLSPVKGVKIILNLLQDAVEIIEVVVFIEGVVLTPADGFFRLLRFPTARKDLR